MIKTQYLVIATREAVWKACFRRLENLLFMNRHSFLRQRNQIGDRAMTHVIWPVFNPCWDHAFRRQL